MSERVLHQVISGAMTCPDCKGRGMRSAFVDAANGGWFDDSLVCGRCKGVGAVDPKQERWLRVGGVHRTWRVAQWESVADCAKRLGVTSAELSGMECGRLDPAALLADTPEELRDAQ